MDDPLHEKVASIRRRFGGADLTRKEVHAEVILDPNFASTTLSDVNRACSKVGKAIGKELSKETAKKNNASDPERSLQGIKARGSARQPLGKFCEVAPVKVVRKRKSEEQMPGEPPSTFLKRSLAQHIEDMVALQPHPKDGEVTTNVEVHPAVTTILLDELDLTPSSRKLSPRQLLSLLPALSPTIHPVSVGEWPDIIAGRDEEEPGIYVWAGFMSVEVIPPSSTRNLMLKIVTRVVGCGKPEMHLNGEHEFDDYLDCKTLQEFKAFGKAKEKGALDRIFQQLRLEHGI